MSSMLAWGRLQRARSQRGVQADPEDPIATRREYQAWRIWGLKRARAAQEADGGSAASSAPIAIGGSPRGGARGVSGDSDMENEHSFGVSESSGFLKQHFSKSNQGLSSIAPVRTKAHEDADSPRGSGDKAAGSDLPSPGTGRSDDGPLGRKDEPSPFANRVDKLHVVLVSAHGLVRGENFELGRDADTGGQARAAAARCDDLCFLQFAVCNIVIRHAVSTLSCPRSTQLWCTAQGFKST